MTTTARRFFLVPAWAALALALTAAHAPAQESGAQDAAGLEQRRAQSAAEHDRILQALTLSEERAARIEAEIAAIRKDNASLSAALVQAAKTERKLSAEVETISARLAGLGIEQDALRASLAARRDVLAEVLGALQRMGLNPPPAILVRPEDALASVRSSILLASVVPGLRGETEVLIADLRQLQRLAGEIETGRARLAATVADQVEEQKRLSLLVEEKRRLQARSEAELAGEQARAAELAAEAGSLAELIEALEGEIEIAALQEERWQAAEQARLDGARTPLSVASPAFSAMKGQLGLPVAGRVGRRFGDNDGSGGTLQGDMLATHSAAIVTAPVDGSVLYAGPFRSYGQLLILNAGEGYHVVLAGMGRISVSPGQAVLAGEPVGLMGESRVASAVALAGTEAGPELYVEFRKEGKPVDPAPWWAERSTGRTRNDS
jgi:septal ring factor EnvC (AmiA/AmiB activator)